MGFFDDPIGTVGGVVSDVANGVVGGVKSFVGVYTSPFNAVIDVISGRNVGDSVKNLGLSQVRPYSAATNLAIKTSPFNAGTSLIGQAETLKRVSPNTYNSLSNKQITPLKSVPGINLNPLNDFTKIETNNEILALTGTLSRPQALNFSQGVIGLAAKSSVVYGAGEIAAGGFGVPEVPALLTPLVPLVPSIPDLFNKPVIQPGASSLVPITSSAELLGGSGNSVGALSTKQSVGPVLVGGGLLLLWLMNQRHR